MKWYEKWPYKQISISDTEQIEIMDGMCECCIAFIDILGFKDMVENNIDYVILALRYIKMFRDSFYRLPSHMGNPDWTEVASEPDEDTYGYENLPKATMFSDSIVISKEIDEYFSFSDFINFIAQLQFELLREGILLRGGIDIGKVYHDEAFIFGKGLISAYLLENEISKYPRITISKRALEKINLLNDEKFENKFKHHVTYNNEKIYLFPQDIEEDISNDEFLYVKEDKDGNSYVNYMYVGCQMIQASKEDIYASDKRICLSFIEDTLSKIRMVVYNGLKLEDRNVREKYEWMKQYFNITIKHIIKTYENRSVDIQRENEEIKEILSELLFIDNTD